MKSNRDLEGIKDSQKDVGTSVSGCEGSMKLDCKTQMTLSPLAVSHLLKLTVIV